MRQGFLLAGGGDLLFSKAKSFNESKIIHKVAICYGDNTNGMAVVYP